MGYLDTAGAKRLETGTVVELADGSSFTVNTDNGGSYVIGDDAVLTVVTVEPDPPGERRLQRRYSPAAWISVTETSAPMTPGAARGEAGGGLAFT